MEHPETELGPFQSMNLRRKSIPDDLWKQYDLWRGVDINDNDGHSPPCLDQSLMAYSPFCYGDIPWYCHKPELFCGTCSLEQFEYWFPRSRWEMFHKLGMVLRIFQPTDHVFVGRTQALFAKNTATLVEQKSLLEVKE